MNGKRLQIMTPYAKRLLQGDDLRYSLLEFVQKKIVFKRAHY